ncbi:formimidoylglutamate deiminase [Microbacterium horticulturae]|uniref:Formimidoylglutamate deiminase n=1 Tax=Microbacterium horticulturae TaxID=3028316 RepID=A0ABY8C0Z7_9MICO|nr:formimidoylglutamate deiminase [Microbacterium sp. KACC 23027]WEG09950.1 formimidoylglutamate deiminase [Microbacterium sp. KACC 23027]
MTARFVVHARAALIDGAFATDVRIAARDGVIAEITAGVPEQPGELSLDVVVPGFVNAHSHAFHRLLRGRTHDRGGDFWVWRERMYHEAAALTPASYRALAEQVFREMRDAGYTAVGEFHYVHHQPDGTPYPDHAMERALADAAVAVGIRLVLLDTCYLRGGVGEPLTDRQRRFGDADAHAWLDRWHALREALTGGLVTVGAAVHSVRAVTPADLAVIGRELPADVPLHVHVSEQVAENDACREAYGVTPTRLLAEHGLLRATTATVHATHLTADDIALLGSAGASVVMCPTTEADLGDGIGPAPELRDAGVTLAIGSDQHAVIDPFEEVARLELDQRLCAQRRGVFTPAQLWHAGSAGGARALGLGGAAVRGLGSETPSGAPGSAPGLRVGDPFDAVAVDAATARTRGADLLQLPLVARAADVVATIVGGTVTRRTT